MAFIVYPFGVSSKLGPLSLDSLHFVTIGSVRIRGFRPMAKKELIEEGS
jgi:hypothetical protein